MGVSAHDVTTTFRRSSIAATAATCRTGGRSNPRSTRFEGKRRRRELVNERRNGLTFHQQTTQLLHNRRKHTKTDGGFFNCRRRIANRRQEPNTEIERKPQGIEKRQCEMIGH